MNTLRHRTVTREGYDWTLEVQEVKGHTPFARQVNLKRGAERWATVRLRHSGKMDTIPIYPSCKVPESVMVEVRKDLNVQNS